MSKPHVHADSSVRRFGGKREDYLEIHAFMDSSKGQIADNRHRTLTHNAWFINQVLPRVFGDTIINSAGRTVSVADIGEQHVMEDFGGARSGYIPSAQDYLQSLPLQPWMNNGRGEPPPSVLEVQKFREASPGIGRQIID